MTQNDLEHYKVKGTHSYIPATPQTQIWIRFALLRAFFLSYRPFWDKYIKFPQNNLEHYKTKGTPNISYIPCPCPKMQ